MGKEARVAVECPIDFIMIWVDGNDPEWQKEKRKYQPGDAADDREIRYRDWDNLQYWFRAVEKFAPWVNPYHFVDVWTSAEMVESRTSQIEYCET